jgi:DNA polymerase-3 subunit delta'
MKDVLGQERVAKWLQTAFQQGRLAHAYLFTGPDGVQMKQMAIELAKTLNCEQNTEEACNQCPTCLQIEHGNHPDVITLSQDGAYIKMDQVRSMQATFRYRAQENITRVLIIEQAEQMRIETANSLLKFLEEPISPMVAILLSERKERILPTIRSRCGWVRFRPQSTGTLQQMYQQAGFEPIIANLLAHLSTARDLTEMTSQYIEQLVAQLIHWSQDWICREGDALLTLQVGWMAGEVEQGRASCLLELLLLWLREILMKETKLFPVQELKRIQIAKRVSPEKCLLAMDNVMIASRLLKKAELSALAILEQMVLCTQEGNLSKENDWHLIVI